MNKQELVDAIAHRANVTKKEADAVLSAALEIIVEEVATQDEQGKHGKVTLVGFGSFEARHRKERQGRNPKTKEKLIIPASTVPAFTAGKSFKDAVANGAKDKDESDDSQN